MDRFFFLGRFFLILLNSNLKDLVGLVLNIKLIKLGGLRGGFGISILVVLFFVN